MRILMRAAAALLLLGILALPKFAAGELPSLGSATGTILDEEGRVLKNIKIRIFAYSQGSFEEGAATAEGDFQIALTPGDWFLGAEAGPESGFTGRGINLPVQVKSGAAVVQNIILKRIAGVISGSVVGPDGAAIDKAVINLVNQAEKPGALLHSTETDTSGIYRFLATAGKYLLRAFSSAKKGIVNPESQELELKDGGLASVSLIFKTPDRKISGRVALGGKPQEAKVWAWSEGGGYSETRSGSDGKYSLFAKGGDRWHLNAAKEAGAQAFQSAEVSIALGSEDALIDLELAPFKSKLPGTKLAKISSDSGGTLQLENGMRIAFPKKFVASEEVKVTVAPFIGSSQKSFQPVGFAYQITLADSNNNPINKIARSAVLEMPYTDQELERAGANEDRLEILFWDAEASVWRSNGNSATVKNKDIVLGITDHFTEFVVTEPEPEGGEPTPTPTPVQQTVTASDGGGRGGRGGGGGGTQAASQPPTPPSALTALAVGEAVIKLTGFDPFLSVKEVYIVQRSTDNVGFREIVRVEPPLEYPDTGLKPDTDYFYRVYSTNADGTSLTFVSASARTLRNTTPPIVGPIDAAFRRTDNDQMSVILTFTTNEPATSETDISGSGKNLKLTKVNLVTLHSYAFDWPPDAPLNILVTATDEFGNKTVSAAPLNLRTPALPQATPISSPSPTPASKVGLKPADIIFTRNLNPGARGPDVQELQRFLNQNSFPVALTGPGSPGLETQFFGLATGATVSRFQEANRAAILTPLGLTRGTNTLGPATRNLINSLRVNQ